MWISAGIPVDEAVEFMKDLAYQRVDGGPDCVWTGIVDADETSTKVPKRPLDVDEYLENPPGAWDDFTDYPDGPPNKQIKQGLTTT